MDRGDLPPPQAQGIVSNRAGGGLSELLPRCKGGNGILLTGPLDGHTSCARQGATADGRNTIDVAGGRESAAKYAIALNSLIANDAKDSSAIK